MSLSFLLEFLNYCYFIVIYDFVFYCVCFFLEWGLVNFLRGDIGVKWDFWWWLNKSRDWFYHAFFSIKNLLYIRCVSVCVSLCGLFSIYFQLLFRTFPLFAPLCDCLHLQASTHNDKNCALNCQTKNYSNLVFLFSGYQSKSKSWEKERRFPSNSSSTKRGKLITEARFWRKLLSLRDSSYFFKKEL